MRAINHKKSSDFLYNLIRNLVRYRAGILYLHYLWRCSDNKLTNQERDRIYNKTKEDLNNIMKIHMTYDGVIQYLSDRNINFSKSFMFVGVDGIESISLTFMDIPIFIDFYNDHSTVRLNSKYSTDFTSPKTSRETSRRLIKAWKAIR